MDKKPLDPQLKQIYDRIMTTPTKAPVIPSPSQPTTPPQQAVVTPTMSQTPLTQPPTTTSPFASVKPITPPLPAQQIFPSLSRDSVTQTPPASGSFTNPTFSNPSFLTPQPTPPNPVVTPPTQPSTTTDSAPYYASTNTSFAQTGSYIPPVNIPAPLPMPNAAETPAMPSIPIRNIRNSADPIIFSTKNKSKNTVTIGGGTTAAQVEGQKSTNILGIVIGVLVVVFLLAYSAFWLIFFGIVEI